MVNQTVTDNAVLALIKSPLSRRALDELESVEINRGVNSVIEIDMGGSEVGSPDRRNSGIIMDHQDGTI